ncbi:hypothetical protein [Brevibacillus porteri]|uniref:hypothetical protein n=1 Tax=Brevibacillus porteri TaxID=2126350 RepID=UPI00363874AF
MFYKCNFCDPSVKRGEKPIKTVNTEVDDFIKDDKGKYYHTNCFRMHLRSRKKMKDEEAIENLITERKKVQVDEIKEIRSRARFYEWIMEYYETDLPPYYCIKIDAIRKGKHEFLREQIDYDTLLDIYLHMASYLNKVAVQKQFNKVTSRMNYDLAVVIGNLGDYKRFKAKQSAQEADNITIEGKLKDSEVVRAALNRKESSESEFNITDIMDELLL